MQLGEGDECPKSIFDISGLSSVVFACIEVVQIFNTDAGGAPDLSDMA